MNHVLDDLAELRRQLARFVSPRVGNHADADDVVQEVLLRIHRSADGVRDDERLSGWIHRVARNAIADHHRRSGRRREVTEPEVDDRVDVDSTRSEPDAAIALASCLAPFVDGLAAPYAEAVRWTELDGLTQREAAERAGISVSGMKSRVQRGRDQLERALRRCCTIELDRRGGVVDYKRRAPRCDDC